MATVMFKRGNYSKVADVILTVIECGEVVFYCRDKIGKKYRVPKSEIECRYELEVESPWEGKRKKKKSSAGVNAAGKI